MTVPELSTEEKWVDYTAKMKPTLEKWNISNLTQGPREFTYFLVYVSNTIFYNYKIIPFISSISLLVLTFLITMEITKKRFAGIVSTVIVLQSGTFLIFDTSVVYSSFWVSFYLLSLYTMIKVWAISPISFILSMLSKSITALFVPMSLFFIYRNNISRKKKILLASSYCAIIIIGLIVSTSSSLIPEPLSFRPHDFWKAFNAISFQMRWDGLVLMFLLPLTFGLFIASRKKILHSDSIMVLITGMILVQPITAAFTPPSSEPYRFLPLVVFFAIGVGTLLSSRFNSKA